MVKKKKAKPAARKPVKKVMKKKAVKRTVEKVAAPAPKQVTALECRICGYRLIIDRECGCAEGHVMVCCGQPMEKTETTV